MSEEKDITTLIEEGERLHGQATPGEWHVQLPMEDIEVSIVVDGPTAEAYDWRFIGHTTFDDPEGPDLRGEPITIAEANTNAAFIVWAHNNIPALLAAAKEGARFMALREGSEIPTTPEEVAFVLAVASRVELPESLKEPPNVESFYEYCPGGCGMDFREFPEQRHSVDECPGPECTCYEIIGGHQMGCYFYGRKA